MTDESRQRIRDTLDILLGSIPRSRNRKRTVFLKRVVLYYHAAIAELDNPSTLTPEMTEALGKAQDVRLPKIVMISPYSELLQAHEDLKRRVREARDKWTTQFSTGIEIIPLCSFDYFLPEGKE